MINNVVGQIIEVRGVFVRAKLFNLLPPYILLNDEIVSAPKINSYVKTMIGLHTVICKIVGEYSTVNYINDIEKTEYFFELEVKGYFSKGKFVQGIRMLPLVGSSLMMLENEDYEKLYKIAEHETFIIGSELFEVDKQVHLEFNSIIPSHIGIFGNTGSGKSNTLAKIYSEYVTKLNEIDTDKARVVLFDLNNEYGKNSITDIKNKKPIKLSTRKPEGLDKINIPVEVLNEDNLGIILNATDKTQVPVLKQAFRLFKKGKDDEYYINYIKRILKNGKKDLFFSLRFCLDDKLKNVDDIIFYETGKKFAYKKDEHEWIFSDDKAFDSDVISNIELEIPEDNLLDKILFDLSFCIAQESERGLNSDFLMPLFHRAKKIFKDMNKVFVFNDKGKSDFSDNNKFVLLQLADLNKDMSLVVPGLISNILFQEAIDRKGEDKINSITNIVVDEAHNLLNINDNDKKNTRIHNSVLENFEKIIKEGRKYGIYLTVSSQRPSDISPTILSQLHNYFIHKLVNPNDIQQIRKAVAYMDENSLNFLTILSPGECILSGTCVKMPVFMHVNEVAEGKRPNSNNVVLFNEDDKKGIFDEN